MDSLTSAIGLTIAEAILVVLATAAIFGAELAITALLGGILLLLLRVLAIGNNLTLVFYSGDDRRTLRIVSSVVLRCADAWIGCKCVPLRSVLALELIQTLFESVEYLLRR